MSTSPITQVKDKYKIKNWQAYNKSLCQRGSLTLWLDESIMEEWEHLSRKKKEAGEQTYSDSIIQCCLLLKINYRLRLRQSTGFMASLFLLMGKSHLAVPDYTTLCRRQKSLPVEIQKRLESGENLEIAIDSTGLKVYGEDDASAGSKMLEGKTGHIRSFHGDGAYDKFGFREVLGSGIHKQTRLPSTKSQRSGNVPVQDNFR